MAVAVAVAAGAAAAVAMAVVVIASSCCAIAAKAATRTSRKIVCTRDVFPGFSRISFLLVGVRSKSLLSASKLVSRCQSVGGYHCYMVSGRVVRCGGDTSS